MTFTVDGHWRSGRPWFTGCLVLGAAVCFAGCPNGEEAQSTRAARDNRVTAVSSVPMPATYQGGKARFEALCVRCHGEAGKGTNAGPPLVHTIYEPSHHGDSAFMRAAAQGVRAHHWRFGDMPRVAGATPEDVKHITAYVRWLQREAGIL